MFLSSLISVGNIIFAITLLAVFYTKNIYIKSTIILVSSLLIKFRPGVDPENISFLLTLIMGAILMEKLPFNKNVNMILAFIIAFVTLNAYLWLI